MEPRWGNDGVVTQPLLAASYIYDRYCNWHFAGQWHGNGGPCRNATTLLTTKI